MQRLIRMAQFADILGIRVHAARIWAKKRGVVVQPNGHHMYISIDKLREAFPEIYGDVVAALTEREAMDADEELL